jgi:ferredoxin-type protein NapG
MGEQKSYSSRREAIKKLFKGTGYLGISGTVLGSLASGLAANKLELRPPGALEEKDFLKACLKCGICVEACPYDSLVLSNANDKAGLGTPYFKPREIPCYMCPDIPCVPVCPSGALDVKKLQSDSGELNINQAKMGLAVVHKESCIAFWGIQCDVCYRACPLIDEAITLEYDKNERTGKHAFLKPVVNGEFCTGCGLCEHACVTEKPAIKVLPIDVATGKVGDHYIKGWDKLDEKRLNSSGKDRHQPEDNKDAIDYLNDWEDLIDE